MTKPVSIHALLVGINDWKFPDQIRSLNGCHNDVALVKATLGKLFGDDAVQATTLHDQQATAEGIVTKFRECLIEPARKWQRENPGKSNESPAFLFHFSGHGTQVVAIRGSKASGMDETLCTYDMERGKNFGLRDWQLGELVDELTAYTDNATIVLDCCHSGSGMRDIEDSMVARQTEPDLSPPPPNLKPRTRNSSRSADGSGGEGRLRLQQSDRSVLLAACQSTQKAFEYTLRLPSKKTAKDLKGVDDSAKLRDPGKPPVYGAFTYSLSQALACMPSGKVPTYDQLHRRACRFMSFKSRSQRPQLEGGRERVLFGSTVKPRDLWLSIRSKDKAVYEVDGGLCHGITEGSELAVFDRSVRTVESRKPCGKLTVISSEGVKCFCKPLRQGDDFPLDAPIAVAKLVPPDVTRNVRLSGSAKDLRQHLEASLAHKIVRFVDQQGDLILHGDEDGFSLRDAEGQLLDRLPAGSNFDSLLQLVRRWACYFTALEIKNDAVGPELDGKIEINILRAPSKHLTEPIEWGDGEMLTLNDGEIVRFEITNHAKFPVYVTLFAFTASGEVLLRYPKYAGQRELLAPGEPYRSPKRTQLFIGDDKLHASVDTLKVIATRDESDFSLLCVNKESNSTLEPSNSHRSLAANVIPSSLTGIMQQAALASNHRNMVAIDDGEDDSWVTAELQYQLVRPVDTTSRQTNPIQSTG